MKKRFDRWDGVLLAAAALVAALFLFARPQPFRRLPGVGWTLSYAAVFALAVVHLRARGQLHFTREGIFLSALALLLSVPYALYANEGMLALNLPVLCVVAIQALYSLAGRRARLTPVGLTDGLRGALRGSFAHIPVPFQAFSRSGRKAAGVLLGLAVGLPVVALVVALLGSADAMFQAGVSRMTHTLDQLAWNGAQKALLFVFLTLSLFSFLYSLTADAPVERDRVSLSLPPVLFGATLFVLAAIYAIFASLQFRYLFAGVEAVEMHGGYAQYARNGFFQLAAVTCITLSLVLFTLYTASSRSNRILCAVVSVLTLIIAVSAAWRMALYIRSYGLTLLRVATLWGIAMMMLSLLIVIVRCICPGITLCPLLLSLWLAGWTALSLAPTDAVIARYNVSAFRSGALEELDVSYLSSLSPDVLAALDGPQTNPLLAEAQVQLEARFAASRPQALYDWSLCWRHVKP